MRRYGNNTTEISAITGKLKEEKTMRYFKDVDGGANIYAHEDSDSSTVTYSEDHKWVDVTALWPLKDLLEPEWGVAEISEEEFETLSPVSLRELSTYLLYEDDETLFTHKDGKTMMLYKDNNPLCGLGQWVDRSPSWPLEAISDLGLRRISVAEFLDTARVPFEPVVAEYAPEASVVNIENLSDSIHRGGFSKSEVCDMLAVVLLDLGMDLNHLSERTRELFWDK